MSSQDDTARDVVPGDRTPTGNEPGAHSTPAADGEGVVDVGDRTDGGAPAANQSKTEPMPPTQAHDDPDAAPGPETAEIPDLGSMNVGADDPQAPSHPAAGPAGDRADAGLPVDPVAPAAVEDSHAPTPQHTTGSAFRAPGAQGVEGAEEQVDTDVEASAARTDVRGTPGMASGGGDAASVPAVSEEKAPGTSQESGIAQGVRTPE